MDDVCPVCGAVWGIEEMDFGVCDCCGYPDDDFFEGQMDPETDVVPAGTARP
ncbi:MAG: hypothetical protein PW843_24365 [Azospirillaceae bacterium]|nr:hypothetical protein [Azospirillaceae bacterium]